MDIIFINEIIKKRQLEYRNVNTRRMITVQVIDELTRKYILHL